MAYYCRHLLSVYCVITIVAVVVLLCQLVANRDFHYQYCLFDQVVKMNQFIIINIIIIIIKSIDQRDM